MSKYNNNEVGVKTIVVGCGPLIGCPTNLLPICGLAPSWQRKDENGDSSCCYPASNVALFCCPICTMWFYPIDKKKETGSSSNTVIAKQPGELVF